MLQVPLISIGNHLLKENKLTYRAEVDGLRALAVISVILFHAGFRLFSGGFVGVDVFFVISGYLITSMIILEKKEGVFSIAGFYERRARRILPALFFILLICSVLAWLLMMPYPLVRFSQSLVAASTAVSNIFFWKTINYFDIQAEELPLLHTWSLGVEEQFYVLFPILVMWFWKFDFKYFFWIIFVLAIFSLGINELEFYRGGVMASFFNAPTRAWELLIGSLIAFANISKPVDQRLTKLQNNLISVIGLGLICFSIFYYSKSIQYSPLYMLIPTFGTAFMLISANKDTFVGRFFSLRWMVGIGLISYSAYLWHQPIFVFTRLYSIDEPGSFVYGMLSIVIIGLAYLTWFFIEKPFRNRRNFSRRNIFLFSIIGSLSFITFGMICYYNKGFKSRFDQHMQKFVLLANLEANGRYVNERFNQLQLGGGGFSDDLSKRKILILGDSHAQDFVNEIFENGYLVGDEIKTRYIPSSCQMYLGSENIQRFIDKDKINLCSSYPNQLSFHTEIIKKADIIILAASWQLWAAERIDKTISNIANIAHTNRIFVIGCKNFGKINIKYLMFQAAVHSTRSRLYLVRNKIDDGIIEANSTLRAKLPPMVFIDQYKAICRGETTCPVFTDDKSLISYDGGHLTKEGAKYIGKLLFEKTALKDIL